MKAIGLWEAAKRGAMAQLVDLEIERKLLEKLIENCNRHLAQGGPVVRRTGVHKVQQTEKQRPHHKGLHWTQRPENRAKLRAVVKKMQKARGKAA